MLVEESRYQPQNPLNHSDPAAIASPNTLISNPNDRGFENLKRIRTMEKFREAVFKLAASDPAKLLTLERRAEIEQRLLEFSSVVGATPSHPTYAAMIHRAIIELNEECGSSMKAISEFIEAEYDDLPWAHSRLLRHHLGKLCETREIVVTVSQRYLIPEPESVHNYKEGRELRCRRRRRRQRWQWWKRPGRKKQTEDVVEEEKLERDGIEEDKEENLKHGQGILLKEGVNEMKNNGQGQELQLVVVEEENHQMLRQGRRRLCEKDVVDEENQEVEKIGLVEYDNQGHTQDRWRLHDEDVVEDGTIKHRLRRWRQCKHNAVVEKNEEKEMLIEAVEEENREYLQTRCVGKFVVEEDQEAKEKIGIAKARGRTCGWKKERQRFLNHKDVEEECQEKERQQNEMIECQNQTIKQIVIEGKYALGKENEVVEKNQEWQTEMFNIQNQAEEQDKDVGIEKNLEQDQQHKEFFVVCALLAQQPQPIGGCVKPITSCQKVVTDSLQLAADSMQCEQKQDTELSKPRLPKLQLTAAEELSQEHQKQGKLHEWKKMPEDTITSLDVTAYSQLVEEQHSLCSNQDMGPDLELTMIESFSQRKQQKLEYHQQRQPCHPGPSTESKSTTATTTTIALLPLEEKQIQQELPNLERPQKIQSSIMGEAAETATTSLDTSLRPQKFELEKKPEFPVPGRHLELKLIAVVQSYQEEQQQEQACSELIAPECLSAPVNPSFGSPADSQRLGQRQQLELLIPEKPLELELAATDQLLQLQEQTCEHQQHRQQRCQGQSSSEPELVREEVEESFFMQPEQKGKQMQQRQLRPRAPRPSGSESLTHAKIANFLPLQQEQEQEQEQEQPQSQCEGWGRLSKENRDADTFKGELLPSDFQLVDEKQQEPPSKRQRGRPPKPKSAADEDMGKLLPSNHPLHDDQQLSPQPRGRGRPPKGRGRPPKTKPAVDKSKGKLLLSDNLHINEQQWPQLQHQGKPLKHEKATSTIKEALSSRQEQEQLQPKRRGRPPKPKPVADTTMEDSAASQNKQ
ncbi:uncharacterized protein LOC131153456 [Malania oleifera]|uniref:uncharacterized protein LOC131153456 n=1 Tax=Malania oleifera TaxID=397392 RepID=UPI0025AE733A|nr:uncharacterized protein LOC131153456 [Malania oleifera]